MAKLAGPQICRTVLSLSLVKCRFCFSSRVSLWKTIDTRFQRHIESHPLPPVHMLVSPEYLKDCATSCESWRFVTLHILKMLSFNIFVTACARKIAKALSRESKESERQLQKRFEKRNTLLNFRAQNHRSLNIYFKILLACNTAQ